MKSVLDKPRLDEVINAYRTVTSLEKKYRQESSISEEEFLNGIQEPYNVIRHNSLYLRSVKPEKYNYRNFQRLIDEIIESGQEHFSMNAFFGWVTGTNAKFTYGSEDKFNNRTNSFNCNSVACIAGYASALAVDWDEKTTSFSHEATNAEHWENIACNWLNIPLEIGEKMFYGNAGSVWSYLKERVDFFYSLDWESDTNSALEYGEYDEYDYEHLEVELGSISYNQAAEMLRMVKDGELEFNEDFEPRLTDKYLTDKYRKSLTE